MLPTSWRPDPRRLLPDDPGTYHGPTIALWFAAAYLTVLTVRSLIHLLAPDGGAESIATMDVDVEGGDNLIALFGQWGAIQLLLAAVLVTLVLRYRGLLPFVLAALLAEPVLRAVAGALKPIQTSGTAPGAALNELAIPVLALALWVSLCPGARTPSEQRVGR